MDLGHVALIGLVIAVIVFKLRASRHKRFRMTFILERKIEDEAESRREKTPGPEGPGAHSPDD